MKISNLTPKHIITCKSPDERMKASLELARTLSFSGPIVGYLNAPCLIVYPSTGQFSFAIDDGKSIEVKAADLCS